MPSGVATSAISSPQPTAAEPPAVQDEKPSDIFCGLSSVGAKILRHRGGDVTRLANGGIWITMLKYCSIVHYLKRSSLSGSLPDHSVSPHSSSSNGHCGQASERSHQPKAQKDQSNSEAQFKAANDPAAYARSRCLRHRQLHNIASRPRAPAVLPDLRPSIDLGPNGGNRSWSGSARVA